MRIRILGGVMLLCALCLFCPAASAERLYLDGVEYEVAAERAEVIGFSADAETVTIHTEVHGVPVRLPGPQESFRSDSDASPMAKELILGEGITDIGYMWFFDWDGLERVTWPSTLRNIGNAAFFGCDALREIRLPEGVVRIEGGAFSSCASLEKVWIPGTLEEMEDGAFSNCPEIRSFDVSRENPVFESKDGVLFHKKDRALMIFPANKGGEYAIPPGTLEILPDAFLEGGGILGLSVPEGVTELCAGVFNSLARMRWLSLPATLTTIEPGTMPIENSELSRVDVAAGNPVFRSVEGVLFRGDDLFFFPRAWGTSYDVPPGTARILDGAFLSNDILETVTFPRGMTEIGAAAFAGCVALKRIALPITLERIGQYAFGDCIELAQVALPPGLKRIEGSAFFNCASLREVVLPDSLQYADAYAFHQCDKDLTLFASRNSEGHWLAWTIGAPWAEPGKRPRTKIDKPKSKTPVAVVNNRDPNDQSEMRAAPDRDAGLIALYPNGTTVEVLSVESGWAMVRAGGLEGYIFAHELKMMDDLTHQVRPVWGRRKLGENGAPFLLYELPLNTAPAKEVSEDVSVQILDSFGVWYKVVCQEEVGYVQSRDLDVARIRFRDKESVYFVVCNPNPRDRLHLRREPSTRSESLGMYFNGVQVKVLEWGEEWMRVQVDGKEGFMMAKFLSPIQIGYDENVLWGQG